MTDPKQPASQLVFSKVVRGRKKKHTVHVCLRDDIGRALFNPLNESDMNAFQGMLGHPDFCASAALFYDEIIKYHNGRMSSAEHTYGRPTPKLPPMNSTVVSLPPIRGASAN